MNWREFIEKNDDWLMYGADEEKGKVIFYRQHCWDSGYTIIFIINEERCYLGDLSEISTEHQDAIMNFLNQKPKKWFKNTEKKYNIIISKDIQEEYFIAYRKDGSEYSVDDFVEEPELSISTFKFSQQDINNLKSQLPDNLAKIVELGKVEVKD